MIDPTILRWHRLENMESVSSCSPPSSSDDNITRSLPSASTNRADPGRLFQLARSEMLAMQTKDAVAARDDERDDALVANKRSEGQIRLLHDTMQPMVHEGGSLTDSDDRNLAERRYVDAMHCDYPMWHRSSGWFPSRSHALVSSRSYHLYDRVRRNGMVPLLQEKPHAPRPIKSTHYGPLGGTSSGFTRVVSSQWPRDNRSQSRIPRTSSARGGRTSFAPNYSSRVVIPSDIIIPKEITTSSRDAISPAEESIGKRSNSDSSNSSPSPSSAKRVKTHSKPLEGRFDKLDLLCSATLELGPLQDNPTGCSCPKSKCIALYCDCFKAGRRCNPTSCTCLNCKNTIEESGANGARSKAIQSILARNPRAFTNAGSTNASNKVPPGEQACNCIRSRCLKLYCTCFQSGKICDASICTCVGCFNTEEGDARYMAIQATLEKRPDAFKEKSKVKEIGAGCACKNNRCIRKYCECFRTSLACSKKCSCRDCENREKIIGV